MNPLGGPRPSDSTHLSVLLDGRLVGEVEADKAKELATKLRTLKTLGQEKVGEIYMHVNFHLKNILPYSPSALMGTMFIMIFFCRVDDLYGVCGDLYHIGKELFLYLIFPQCRSSWVG